MAFTLKLNMAALCAFVPVRSGEWHAVFLNASRKGRLASDGESLHAHSVQLFYDASVKARCVGREPKTIQINPNALPLPPNPVGFTLRREEIVVRDAHGKEFVTTPRSADGEPTVPVQVPLTFATGREPGSLTAYSPTQCRDFSWIARIGQVRAGAGRVKSHCADRDPEHLVSARIRLTAGELGAHPDTVSEKIRPFHDLLETEPLGNYVQALAWAAQLEIPVETDSVTMWSSAMAGGRDDRWVLTLFPPDVSLEAPFVEVWVANLPQGMSPHSHQGDDRGKPHAEDQGKDDYTHPDRHFELFYDLCPNWNSSRPRPVPWGQPIRFHVPPENCYAVAFDGLTPSE